MTNQPQSGDAVAALTNRPKCHHDLKTDDDVFDAVFRGDKTHEIRFNDRNFKVGDTIELFETRYTGQEMRGPEPKPLEYTGRTCVRTVSHVMTGYGLMPGWCILSFAPTAPESEASDAVLTSEMLNASVPAYQLWKQTEQRHGGNIQELGKLMWEHMSEAAIKGSTMIQDKAPAAAPGQRCKFKMTADDLAKLIDAVKPKAYIIAGGRGPMSVQESANIAWRALGDRMGFDGMTVQPTGEGDLIFTAIAKEPKP